MPQTVTLAGVTIQDLIPSWVRHLRAANLSPRTIRSYSDGLAAFAAFLEERGMPNDVGAVSREHVEHYIEDVLARWKPSTALTRYRDLQQFFRWAVDEGEIGASPMVKMRPPKLDEREIPVIRTEDLRALLSACSGRSFEDRRDTAIIRVFMNTGARLAEVAGLAVDDVDLDHGEMKVRRKGARTQTLPLGAKTIKALDRYVRSRRSHNAARLPDLWLGASGALTDSGIAQMVKRRCREAGIAAINIHRFRHTWAHTMKKKGASDETLQTIGGWKSPAMLTRYAASTATERAKEVHFRLAPGEDL